MHAACLWRPPCSYHPSCGGLIAPSIALDATQALESSLAIAADTSSRLRVAQEQFCEYAQQKKEDAARLFQHANAVTEMVASQGSPQEALVLLRELQSKISEAAEASAAFAAQQFSDLKRSSHKVCPQPRLRMYPPPTWPSTHDCLSATAHLPDLA